MTDRFSWKKTITVSAISLLIVSTGGCAHQTEPPQLEVVQPITAKPKTASTKAIKPSQHRFIGRYSASALKGDYAGYAAVEQFIQEMVSKHGFNQNELRGVLSAAKRKQWTLDFLKKSDRAIPSVPGAVSRGSWSRYRAKFLDTRHIQSGVTFWAKHAKDLQRATQTYGVPAEYILGIMAVETTFGSYIGNHRIIDALTTLAFDYPRRADYFRGELENYLIMASEEGFDPLKPVGSYAGAMGLGQFMPSSFMHWAVDFDGNGRKDLWNPVDALGSVANYFAQHGWKPGGKVVTAAKATNASVKTLESGFNKTYPLPFLTKTGLVPQAKCDPKEPLYFLHLSKNDREEYWLGHHNYYVITRYNHSTHYAMAVHELAQEIKKQYRQKYYAQR